MKPCVSIVPCRECPEQLRLRGGFGDAQRRTTAQALGQPQPHPTFVRLTHQPDNQAGCLAPPTGTHLDWEAVQATIHSVLCLSPS